MRGRTNTYLCSKTRKPPEEMVANIYRRRYVEEPLFAFLIYNVIKTKAVNHRIQQPYGTIQPNTIPLAAEHSKMSLRISFNINTIKYICFKERLIKNLQIFHSVNAVCSNLFFFYIISQQIIISVVNNQRVWNNNIFYSLSPF